ncbi:MAG: Flp pilus assembly protein CpaB [Bacteriovoracaceae bacterium]|nr:Flp pilus assembly protein CpaB [Bacteriovoracaceae bacterium]
MNTRAFTLSLVIAGIAMFMVYSYMSGREAEFVKQYGKMSPVVVAKVDIKELELIDDSKVMIMNVPQNFLSPGHFKTIEELYSTVASVPLLKGEQITRPRVTYPGDRTGLSRQVSVGKRAVSIRVSPEQAVGKLIKPGDRVDILALVDYAGGKKNELKLKTILQDVLVLSTGLFVTNSLPLVGYKNSQEEVKTLKLNTYSNYDNITLELSPYEAQRLMFVVSGGLGGRWFLSLRNNDDKERLTIRGSKLIDLMDEDAVEAKRYFTEEENKNNPSRLGGK